MKGIIAVAVVCLLADFTDANVANWTESGFNVSAGTGTASVRMKWATKVAETSTAGDAIVTLTAIPSATYTYAFTSDGNPGSVGNIATPSATAGAITLATGKSIDYETTKSLVFVVTATPSTGTAGTATVTVEFKNKLEFSNTHYVVCVADGTTAGTTVGTYTVADKASDDTIAYTHTPTTSFDYGGTTGVVSVKTGVTLNMKTLGGHELTLTATATAGSSVAGTAKLWIAVGTCSSSALQITAMLGIVVLSFATAFFL